MSSFLICQCEYKDLNEACQFCSDRSLQCGTKLSAKGARAYELAQQLSSLQREAGMVPFPDVSKLSAIASELERRFPAASVGEIYAMAKPTVENAIAVAAGQSRNDGFPSLFLVINDTASSILFPNSIVGDTTPNSLQHQIPSARHTPVQPENPFRTPATLPQQLQQTQQPVQTHRHHETTPYDMETWFNTFPTPGNAATTASTDFTQFQQLQVILVSVLT